MKNKFWLLLITISIFIVGVYFFIQTIQGERYSKEFSQEISEYMPLMNAWSKKEEGVIENYNTNVVEKAKNKSKTVEAYEYLKESTIPEIEKIINDVKSIEVKEKETKEIKEKFLSNLEKEKEMYEIYYDSYKNQKNERFEEAGKMYEDIVQEKKNFGENLNMILDEIKAESEKK